MFSRVSTTCRPTLARDTSETVCFYSLLQFMEAHLARCTNWLHMERTKREYALSPSFNLAAIQSASSFLVFERSRRYDWLHTIAKRGACLFHASRPMKLCHCRTWPALLCLLERRGKKPQHSFLDYSITNYLVGERTTDNGSQAAYDSTTPGSLLVRPHCYLTELNS